MAFKQLHQCEIARCNRREHSPAFKRRAMAGKWQAIKAGIDQGVERAGSISVRAALEAEFTQKRTENGCTHGPASHCLHGGHSQPLAWMKSGMSLFVACASACNSFWTQVWQGTCPITSPPNGIGVAKNRNAFAAGSPDQVIGLQAESTERLNELQIAKKPRTAASCLGKLGRGVSHATCFRTSADGGVGAALTTG